MEYPKALYQTGNEYDINGTMVDMITVDSADEETSQRHRGWASFEELNQPAENAVPRRGRPPKQPAPEQDG